MTNYESSRRIVGKAVPHLLPLFITVTSRTLSRYTAGADERSVCESARASESRRVGSERNLLCPVPGGRLIVGSNIEGQEGWAQYLLCL